MKRSTVALIILLAFSVNAYATTDYLMVIYDCSIKNGESSMRVDFKSKIGRPNAQTYFETTNKAVLNPRKIETWSASCKLKDRVVKISIKSSTSCKDKKAPFLTVQIDGRFVVKREKIFDRIHHCGWGGSPEVTGVLLVAGKVAYVNRRSSLYFE